MQLVERVAAHIQLPIRVSPAYWRDFLHRYRPLLLELAAEALNPSFATWKQEHQQLQAFLTEAAHQGWADVPLNQGVAGLVRSHADREERAFLRIVSSPFLEHLMDEHRAIEPMLLAVDQRKQVFTQNDLAFIFHHFKEEEVWVQTLTPVQWEYRALENALFSRFLPAESTPNRCVNLRLSG
jgi:hypothetical protein